MGFDRFTITADAERAMIAAAQAGDQSAMRALIEQFEPLVLGYVRKRAGYGVDPADLKQEGRIGLHRAITGFDLAKYDSRLSTYASWWIRTYVDEYVRKNWCDINFKGTAGERGSLWRNIATTVGRPTSIDAPDGNGLTFTLRDESVSAEDALGEKQQKAVAHAIISKRMEKLNSQQRQVIKGRWLCDEAMTLEEVSLKMGVTKQRIDQIERRALEIMGLAHLRRSKKDKLAALC